MKILKIFGVVVGIHVFALVLIFANPGCSSTSKPPPQPADTVATTEPAPMITMPSPVAAHAPSPATDYSSAMVTAAPVGFNPDAQAGFAGSGPGVRFTPTRPNTPAASAVQSQPVENVTPATTYVVKPGDSLWTLQKKFHVSVKDIAAANNLKTSSTLHDGQKLIIPSKTPSTTPATKAASAGSAAASASSTQSRSENVAAKTTSGEVTYTVKPGDTIEAIAKRFEVKPKDLAVHNNIENPLRLRAGSVLSIPGWKSTTASKSGSTGASDTAAKAAPRPAAIEPKPASAPLIEIEPSPAPTSNVPVIRIDDSPVSPSPAPKQ